jgi:hypothetical protein
MPGRSSNREGGAYGPQVAEPGGREKPLSEETRTPVPQTDTGRWVEHTKAHERTLVKELGKSAA